MAEKKKEEIPTPKEFLTTSSGEKLLKDAEEFLDKIAEVAGVADVGGETEGATGGADDQKLFEEFQKFERLVVSEEEGEVPLPNSVPPFSDFVPKAGRDLDQQEIEHNKRKEQKLHQKLEKQRDALNRNLEEDDDSDTDDIVSSDEENDGVKNPTDDNPYLSSKVNYPTLTELIFGEKFSMEDAEAKYSPDKLQELLHQIIPQDKELREEEGIPMPEDDSPINFKIGQALSQEKLKALHEMLGLYDENGQKRKGLFDSA